MSRVLLTGGAGFIGSNIAGELLNQDHYVVCLDNLYADRKENILEFEGNENFVFVNGDIRDLKTIQTILREHSIKKICHQAARGSVPKSVNDPILTNSINIDGTLNVLWAAKEEGVKRVVLAISSSIYGDAPTLPKVETMPYNPKSPYAISKVANDMYCRNFFELYGLETAGLRYFNVYGPKQDPEGAYAAVIPKFILSALRNQPLVIEGNGEQTRDFSYISDVVNANMLALTSQKAPGHSMNIAYGKRISVNDLAGKIIQFTNSHSEIRYIEPRKGDVKDSLADLSLAKEKLGYVPKVAIEEGLKRTVEWFQKKV
jgi:dTDP-glucose 4,6-dehydratase